MSGVVLYFGMSGILFVSGMLLIALRSNRIFKLIGMNVMGSGVFMLFIALAARSEQTDPVPHAMVLTGIVVTVVMTMVAGALITKISSHDSDVRADHE